MPRGNLQEAMGINHRTEGAPREHICHGRQVPGDVMAAYALLLSECYHFPPATIMDLGHAKSWLEAASLCTSRANILMLFRHLFEVQKSALVTFSTCRQRLQVRSLSTLS